MLVISKCLFISFRARYSQASCSLISAVMERGTAFVLWSLKKIRPVLQPKVFTSYSQKARLICSYSPSCILSCKFSLGINLIAGSYFVCVYLICFFFFLFFTVPFLGRIIDQSSNVEIASFPIYKVLFCVRGQNGTSESDCFAFTESSCGTEEFQIHVFSCEIKEAVSIKYGIMAHVKGAEHIWESYSRCRNGMFLKNILTHKHVLIQKWILQNVQIVKCDY